ncbi:hypothetical protein TCE0_018r06210 [Talaromyces pinophilus]|uniref:BZIP domain-containing protein n=1 Tax=Talaromyces pinophilus TaxID=128442 RepID=A0A510NX46_TALPI|nr:hypothetical protein TCE0_018r06210 [Talaromyces pinophilus]
MAGKNKGKDLVVPELAEDAAQRQRKKERLRSLESQLKADGENPTLSCPEPSTSTQRKSDQSQVLVSDLNESDVGPAPGVSSTKSTLSQGHGSSGGEDAQPVISSGQFDVSFWSPFQPYSESINDPCSLPTFDKWSGVDIFTAEQGIGSNCDVFDDNAFPYNVDISSELQTSEAATFTFPDDRLLEVPSLVLLRAALQVAQRLNIADLIWDLGANSPFYQGHAFPDSATSSPSSHAPSLQTPSLTINTDLSSAVLPAHLRPTTTQILIPHHPILDLLPWPSTRDKLIRVFNLPPHLRPKSAQSPMGLVQLVQDMEDDTGEGVRPDSCDPFDACGWEIGQLMFEKWWWAFETEVVVRSNQARKKRGKNALTMQGSEI